MLNLAKGLFTTFHNSTSNPNPPNSIKTWDSLLLQFLNNLNPTIGALHRVMSSGSPSSGPPQNSTETTIDFFFCETYILSCNNFTFCHVQLPNQLSQRFLNFRDLPQKFLKRTLRVHLPPRELIMIVTETCL